MRLFIPSVALGGRAFYQTSQCHSQDSSPGPLTAAVQSVPKVVPQAPIILGFSIGSSQGKNIHCILLKNSFES